MKFAMIFALPFLSVAAFAADVPAPIDVDQALGFLPGLVDAAMHSNWLAFGASMSMILTFAIKKYLLPTIGVGSAALPWVSLLIGALAGYGGAVLAGGTAEAALMGLLSGPVASLLWDAIGQYFLPKKA